MKESIVEYLIKEINHLTGLSIRMDEPIVEYALQMEKEQTQSQSEEKGCVELSSWEAADKVTLNGYVYVRSADLKFCGCSDDPDAKQSVTNT